MNEIHYLNELAPGDRACVLSLGVDGETARRLTQLGMTAGVPVTCLQRAPAGDPTAYQFQGVTVALRRDAAERIQVEGISHVRP
jgi:ferrous iron transport protein A